jgi:hypothetical protein
MGYAVADVREQDVDVVGQISGDGLELALSNDIAGQLARLVVTFQETRRPPARGVAVVALSPRNAGRARTG